MSLSVNIRKQLGDFRLEVQFEAENEPLALLGASGCGKSATLRCIAGLLTPDEGRIVLDGVPLYDSAARINLPPQRRKTALLFQQYALFPNMTVRQNIAAAVPGRARRRDTAAELLRRFRLEDAADKRICRISGGQQQRTALARILASEPKAILLDEPLSALDSYLRLQLELELIQALEQFPRTVLWVSHDRGEVFRTCRRICVMDGGRSQPVCTAEALFRSPGTEAAARLSGCENLARAAAEGTSLRLPEWGLLLNCGQPVSGAVCGAGIRARHIHPAEPGAVNVFSCRVLRVIEDVFSTAVLLMPLGAAPGAPPMRMELDKPVWQSLPDKSRLTASVSPEDILLLRAPQQGGSV